MEELKKAALDTIEENKELIASVADQIWEYAELSLQEVRSAALYCKILKELGFAVEEGVCSISTAFVASYGSGRPIIGILAEYDALSGLSQLGGSIKKQELTPGGTGHGCGHNLLGAGALAAALGIKHYLQQSGAPGTVVLYGCPGEEGGAAKAFMAREKLWYGLDAALTWHPDDCNEAATGSSNACIQVQYIFHGVAAHAAGNPERGRSALDAVTLMNVGVQFLREHMEPQARIHYAVTDGGGCSPNVVQSKASVLYMVRSPQTIPNHVLEALLYQNFAEVGVPQHTSQEMTFAAELAATYDAGGHIPGSGSENADYAARVKTLLPGTAMNDVLLPLFTGEAFCPGSTDVGDVSWQCPTAQLHVASWPNGCPGHSWQNVSCGKTSIGHKAAITAGKVLCAAAIDLLKQPELIAAAKTEFAGRTAEGYTCPIPPEAVPTIPD